MVNDLALGTAVSPSLQRPDKAADDSLKRTTCPIPIGHVEDGKAVLAGQRDR